MSAGSVPLEPSDEAQSMAGWAQLLHDVVEQRLSSSAPTELRAPSWDTMFDEALSRVMQQMLAERLERLTPEQFLTAYRRVHGDDALAGALDRLLPARAEAAERERTALRLAAQARIAGRLRLADLARDDTVHIGLFDPTQPQLAAWRYRDNAENRPLQRLLRVRVADPATGGVDVVADTWTGAVWDAQWRTPTIRPLSTARIGTRPGDSADVLPELTLHAPLVIELDDGTVHAPPQIVGYVRTLDGQLLLDEPAAR